MQIEAAITKFDKAGNGKLNYVEFCGMMNAGKNRKESEAVSGPGNKSVTPQVMAMSLIRDVRPQIQGNP